MILSYFSLFLAILATAFGQFFYKKFALTKNRKYYFITISLFVFVPFLNFIALKNIAIDIVYIFTSLTIFLVLLFSKLFLHEQILLQTYKGVSIIILGVIIYAS